MNAALRVGIDVGGTFTDVVVLAAGSGEMVARIKVPTTHDAPGGVAEGIVTGLERALATPGVDASRIAFIAHSTTQATNALLEGDVARVGIVGLHGSFGWLARSHLRVPPIVLAANASLVPSIAFARSGDDAGVARALDVLANAGVEAIVASEAFGVDRPDGERRAVAAARARGTLATSGHDVASAYGLRARTRTAVINAAILPRMVRTARMTAEAVARAGIGAPLMIMRSDGGVMDVGEVARRPILTMLSGPAAGIAGALLHENVTDGIFIEVGGTSADCSVIRRGLPQMQPARIGGFRTMLRTLDVRTLAIAGGSIVRLDPRGRGASAVRGVGPRSAHIAGLAYACFTREHELATARISFVAPKPGDPADYLALELASGSRATLTPTCAANLLGYARDGDFARGDVASARRAFELVGERVGLTADELARAVLERSAETLRGAIDELIADYELVRADVELVGGGGGAAALVPFAAERLGFRHRLARDADVISPLGVALALVRDVVERTIVAPTPDDVLRVRREALERVIAAGATPESSVVTVEIEARRNLVRATASGATAAGGDGSRASANVAERRAAAARTLGASAENIVDERVAGDFTLFSAARKGATDVAVVDARGVVRLVVRRASVDVAPAARVESALARVLEGATSYGDVGRALPEIHLVYGSRVADLGTVAESEQLVALAKEEIRGLEPDVPVTIVAARREA